MKTSRSRTFITLASAAVMLLVMACGFLKVNLPGEAPTATAAPSATAEPTLAPASTSTVAPTATAKPTPTAKPIAANATPTSTGTQSIQIDIRPITETQQIETLKSTITMNVSGTNSIGKVVSGELTMELITNYALQQRSLVMQGELLPYVVSSQKGITRAGMYLIDGNTYTLYEGSDQKPCEKLASTESDFAGMSPESLLSIFSNDEHLYGSLVGDETINDIPTKHYTIDVAKTKEASARSGDASSSDSIQFMQAGDLYLASTGSYPVLFTADYQGQLDLFQGGLDGKMTARFDVSELNTGITVELPEACANASTSTDVAAEATPEETPEVTPLAGAPEQLVFKPITETMEVDTLVSTMFLGFDGKDTKGKTYQGDATIELTANKTLEQRAIVMKGTLLATLMQQPSLESLQPSLVGLYDMSGDIYVHLQSQENNTDFCARTTDATSTEALDILSPEGLIASFARSEDTYGAYAGDETINGIDTRHYVLDAAATNAAALQSTRTDVRAAAGNLKMVSGDVYIAVDGDYVVSLQAQYTGTMAQFGFTGAMRVGFEISELNSGIEFTLPAACTNAITQ